MGLTALAAGRLLGIPLSGIYHTDFPQYVRLVTQDESLEQLTWQYMHWFYDQMQTIYVPSECYRRHLIEHGFDSRKLKVLKKGIDAARFSPDKRDPQFFPRLGASNGFTFLYVGRVAKEKNIDLLLESFDRLVEQGFAADLVIVGDGPCLQRLRRQYKRRDVFFTGLLVGESLATAYASADAFVFPSTTDTFGNVILEAQASGLPSIVSSHGGPAEVVEHRRTGLIFDANDANGLLEAMKCLRGDEPLRQLASRASLENAAGNNWSQVLDQLWTGVTRLESSAAQNRLARIRSTGASPPLVNLEVA
jgi:glycosyltransferase involved in cell wall biosynthesis